MASVNSSISALPIAESPMPKGSLCFPKSERLCHDTLITALFAKGKSEYAFPMRMTYRLIEASEIPEELRSGCLQLMVNVPKKKFKRAVKRVRYRRLMREAWRLQRVPLRERIIAELPGKILHVGIVYMSSDEASFETIKTKMAKLLAHLDKKLFTPEPEESAVAEPKAPEQNNSVKNSSSQPECEPKASEQKSPES